MTVTERLDAVIDATAALTDIRTQLAKLDKERVGLEEQARRILEMLAEAAVSALRPVDDLPVNQPKLKSAGLSPFWAASRTLTDRIMEFLESCPGTEFGAAEVTAALGADLNVDTVRGTLSRLNSEGRITRAGYGKYKSLPSNASSGEVEAAL